MKAKSIVTAVLGIVSVAGVIATGYFCAKETPAAKEALDKAREEATEEFKKDYESRKTENETDEENEQTVELHAELTWFETLKVVAPHYKKTIAVAGVTILTIVGGHIVHVAITGSALAGAYAWQKKYTNLDKIVKDKAKEMGLSSFHKDVKTDLAKTEVANIKKDNVKKNKDLAKALNSKVVRVYDDASGQIIWTTQERLFYAQLTVNKALQGKGKCSQNTFLTALGGHSVDDGDKKGWSMENTRQMEEMCENPDGETTWGPFVECFVNIGKFPAAGDEEVLYIYYNCYPDYFEDEYESEYVFS